ncbi:NUDIX hydrolase [Candidatus Venteria ishoeyi]|uniref:Bifunctional nicotinamide mononucleotide adenylyltransferase/ADP-ribose pyrophosphatase n=1 Tax=Candidatus Venteria ishoeyi TaxID=1899563 RepID=A0A1H6FHZ8_9GAMM|nr:NUDIX domain-containing protein [Candidatus Venteria ishoeyi]SEH08675.1 bifunctional nicotinamide mononucleotide adenylyltransferase/ADP-ribose pyrophosphatase [Candidatus Venteria ishoeyi]
MTAIKDSRPAGLAHYKKPTVMVDIVIFTIADDTLKVLLIKRGIPPFKGHYALPGGAVRVDTDMNLEAAAQRELEEETGVENNYLEQLYTYGGIDRDPRDWTVSVAYFALVAKQDVQLKAGTDAAEAHWHSIQGNRVELPLAFDHAPILQDAIERLRAKLDYTDIAVHLLPEEFTLSEFQRVYEIIMQEKLNKSSFRKRVSQAEIVQPIAGKMRTGSNRPAQLYRFTENKTDRMFFPRSIVWAERGKHE